MSDLLSKIIGDLEGKKEWKALQARAAALPEDYRFVYDEIKSYIWNGGTELMDPTNVFKRVVDLFEEGAASGKHVLDVTGGDVAGFVEDLARGGRTYLDDQREKLNQAVAKKLGK